GLHGTNEERSEEEDPQKRAEIDFDQDDEGRRSGHVVVDDLIEWVPVAGSRVSATGFARSAAVKTLRERFVESFVEDPAARRGRKNRRTGEAQDLSGIIFENSGVLTFLGLTMGIFVSRKFFVIPLAVGVTLAQEFAKGRLTNHYGRQASR